MKQEHRVALTCTGAVVGAGFASGREIVVFFSRYGGYAVWLIIFASLVMAGICALCMKTAQRNDFCDRWTMMLAGGKWGRYCSMGLLVVTAGAMLAAAGETIRLILQVRWAYQLGLLGTLLTAGLLGRRQLKGLGICSAILMLCLLCALMAALTQLPAGAVEISSKYSLLSFLRAALDAFGYASMNMTLAMGVVFACAEWKVSIQRSAGWFGGSICMLMLLSHYAYSRLSTADSDVFPMVVLLSRLGRNGFYFAGLLLYLSILTTLSSVLYALRTAVESCVLRPSLRFLLWAGLPMAVSGVGFTSIVDKIYVPGGLVCFACLFLPMIISLWKQEAIFS